MTEAHRVSPDQLPAGWSDAAPAYQEWFDPLTRHFAADVVRLLGVGAGSTLLDVATGTGALAVAAAAAGAEVLAVDFAPAMVATAQRALGDSGRTARMDGQALELPDGTFDAAASLFGLIFFPDLAAGARELARVVRPGGRVAVAAWSRDGSGLQPALIEALVAALPGFRAPARPPVPFRLGTADEVRALLTGARLNEVAVEVIEHDWPVPDPAALFRAVPGWAIPLRRVYARLDPAQLDRAGAAFADALARRGRPDSLTMRALIGLGTR